MISFLFSSRFGTAVLLSLIHIYHHRQMRRKECGMYRNGQGRCGGSDRDHPGSNCAEFDGRRDCRAEGCLLYTSSYLITGSEGDPLPFDPLKIMLEEAHNRGLTLSLIHIFI